VAPAHDRATDPPDPRESPAPPLLSPQHTLRPCVQSEWIACAQAARRVGCDLEWI